MSEQNIPEERRKEREQREKRKHWEALLLLLLVEARADCTTIVNLFVTGQISAYEFGQMSNEVLLPAHQRAAYIGRRAGSATPEAEELSGGPQNIEDLQAGVEAVEAQKPYMQKFVEDLGGDKYVDEDGVIDTEAIQTRLFLYVEDTAGTANDEWLASLDPNTLVWWEDVKDAAECEDCVMLAGQSPWRAEDLPTSPGNGDTQCLYRCRCHLRLGSGAQSFNLRVLLDGDAE